MSEIKCGDIVYLQKNNSVFAEVVTLTDKDKALIRLCDNELEAVVDISELEVTDKKQCCLASGREVNILGTPYKILIIEEGSYMDDREADGWCDYSSKEILVKNYKQDRDSFRDLVAYQHKVIRHEIVHAFLYESGLNSNSFIPQSTGWARNEEMVDWMAIQVPKMIKAFREAGVLGYDI